LALFEWQETMSLPGFHEIGLKTALELRTHIADRVRLERRKTGLSQQVFAEKCGIPLRTFKRFEQGECDSLEAFLRIVVVFERVVGLELLFPPKQAVVMEVRSPTAALERLQNRLAGRTSRK
jgi:transcriptional regulator with XRE-family HTH domain